VDTTTTLTFGERLQASFQQLYSYIPALFGALVILFAGYLLARLLEKGTDRLMRRIHLNAILERGGVMQAVDRSGSRINPTRVAGSLVFWFVMFAVMLVAANALGLQSLANVFSELVSYIPSVIAAIVIMIVGPTLARAGKGGVVLLATFMALQELGVATEIVTTAFAILFGAIALALSLAFGLGNRELAGEVTRNWYQRYKEERENIDSDNRELDKIEGITSKEEYVRPIGIRHSGPHDVYRPPE
jgi:Conserved TM helix